MLEQLNRTARSFVFATLFAAPLALAPSIVAAGETANSRSTATATVKAPMTREEHLAKAEEYRKKAAAYRAEAAVHHKMLEENYGVSAVEGGGEDPFVTRTRSLCDSYIKKAEALAIEAEKFADFHRMRAAELEGK